MAYYTGFPSAFIVHSTTSPDIVMVYNPYENREETGEVSTYTTDEDSKVDDMNNFVKNKSGIISNENSKGSEFSYNELMVTRFINVPCLLLMLISSLLLVYVILKHLRTLLYLYISVLFYALTQVQLVLVVVVSWSLSGVPLSKSFCQCLVTLQSVSLVFPAYGLLYITVVRTIFLRHPFDNDLFLKMRYQLCGVFIGLCFCGVVFSLPYFGVCGIGIIHPAYREPYCGYESGTVACTVFTTVALVVGYILPVLLVLLLYAVIYHTVIIARRNSRRLTASQSEAVDETEKGDNSVGGKSSSMIDRMRKSMPWCIITILFLYIISTVPWIPMDLYTPKVESLFEKGHTTLLFDIQYSLLLVGCALSPLTYLISSNTLRGLVFIEYKKLRDYIC